MAFKVDKRSAKKLIRDLKKTKESLVKSAENIDKKYVKELKSNLEYIGRTTIDMFYESYDPTSYQRKYDLYNTYNIMVTEKKYEVNFSESYMKYRHRVSNSYIYDIAFLQGYHGGANSGPNHPEPGVPWWKDFSNGSRGKNWLEPAAKTSSPYQHMRKRMSDYISSIPEQKKKDFEKENIRNIENLIDTAIKMIK